MGIADGGSCVSFSAFRRARAYSAVRAAFGQSARTRAVGDDAGDAVAMLLDRVAPAFRTAYRAGSAT